MSQLLSRYIDQVHLFSGKHGWKSTGRRIIEVEVSFETTQVTWFHAWKLVPETIKILERCIAAQSHVGHGSITVLSHLEQIPEDATALMFETAQYKDEVQRLLRFYDPITATMQLAATEDQLAKRCAYNEIPCNSSLAEWKQHYERLATGLGVTTLKDVKNYPRFRVCLGTTLDSKDYSLPELPLYLTLNQPRRSQIKRLNLHAKPFVPRSITRRTPLLPQATRSWRPVHFRIPLPHCNRVV